MKNLFTLFSTSVILLGTSQGFARQSDTVATKKTMVVSYVAGMPQAPYDINEYIHNNVHYPDAARKNGIHGKVVVRFVVNADGTIGDCSIVKGIGYGCDEEALRTIKNMPPWIPDKQSSKQVNFFQPIQF